MSFLSLSVMNKLEQEIRKTDGFQYLESNKKDEVIEALRQISIRSGLTIYIWTSDLGMVDIKSRQTSLPATKTVMDALKYANKNHYFAVYVFPILTNKDLLDLKTSLPSFQTRFNKTGNKNTKFLFLVDDDTSFHYLSANGNKIELVSKNVQKYKLRDGQWVTAHE